MSVSKQLSINIKTKYDGKIDLLTNDVKQLSAAEDNASKKTNKLEHEFEELSSAVTHSGRSFDKTADEANRLDNELDDLGSSAKSGNAKWKDYAMQAAAVGAGLLAVGMAAKKAWEVIGEGAALDRAVDKFDNLAVSIGTVGDELLGKMTVATKGMLSQSELIASGTDIMSLGLAKSEEGVVRMATAVGALNLDMQVLALTLANDSVARLDNLGLSMERVKKIQKELKESGFIGDAFDEAVLIALEEKMTLLGDASETTAGKMQILTVLLKDLKDRMLQTVSSSEFTTSSVDKLSNALSDLESRNKAIIEAQTTMNRAVYLGFVSQERANLIVKKSIDGHELWQDELTRVMKSVYELDAANAQLSSTAEDVDAFMATVTARTTDAAEATRLNTLAQLAATDTSGNYADALYDSADAEGYLKEQLIIASDVLRSHVADFNMVIGAVSNLSGAIANAYGDEAISNIEDAQGEWINITRDNTSEILEITNQLNADLDSNQVKHYRDVLKNEDEGSAAWLQAYSALQDDLTDKQRNSLIARSADLEASSGEIQSIYTGDAELAEEMAERQAAANLAIEASYKDLALSIVNSKLTDIIGEGGASAESAALGYIALQESLGLITGAEAEALQQVAINTIAIKEKTSEMTDSFLADGVLTRAEADKIAAAVGNISGTINDIPPIFIDTEIAADLESKSAAAAEAAYQAFGSHKSDLLMDIDTSPALTSAEAAAAHLSNIASSNYTTVLVADTTSVDASVTSVSTELSGLTEMEYITTIAADTELVTTAVGETSTMLIDLTAETYTAAIDADIAAASTRINTIEQRIKGVVNANYTATVHVRYDDPGMPSHPPSNRNGGDRGRGYASGGDFMVPNGYPNDSYPMLVQSGEHVIVETPQQQRTNSGTRNSNTINLTINTTQQVNTSQAIQMARAWQD